MRILVLLMLSTLPTYAQDSIPHIGAIMIERLNVFDSTDSGLDRFIGPIANTIHVKTRERVIRNELLFKEGDGFDSLLVEESARNLRALSFIGDISVRTERANDTTVDIQIQTRDKWTTSLSPSYQQGGGVKSFGMTAKEDNFLGNAQSISLGYGYRSDLNNPHAVDLVFSDRQLLGSHWGTTIQLKHSQDETIQTIFLHRAFFSDQATWATGFYFDSGDLLKPYYENGVRIREDQIYQQNVNAFFAQSFGGDTKLRPSVALVNVRSSGTNLRPDDNLMLVNLALNLMDRRFSGERYLNNHGRIEDVPLGYLANVIVGRNFYCPQGDEPKILVQANWQQAFIVDGSFYLSYGLAGSSLFGNGSLGESVVQSSLLSFAKLGEQHVLVARVVNIRGIDWVSDRQLFLGSNTGLRGYDSFDLTGQSLFSYTVEDRLYLPGQFWIFRPGIAFFVDGGAIWSQGTSPAHQQFHTSVGAGLRIENTKQQGSGILRIDVAYNFDRKGFGQIIISSALPFSAFSDIGFISPVTTGLF